MAQTVEKTSQLPTSGLDLVVIGAREANRLFALQFVFCLFAVGRVDDGGLLQRHAKSRRIAHIELG